ncbi:MAG: hypothetical protein ACI4K6_04050 [Candidatus Fimenecus sp.]
MVFYRPITDRAEIARLFPTVSLPTEKTVGAYVAEENGAFCGKCMVAVDGQGCEISQLAVPNGDALLAEGLLRSALHFAGNRNAYTAVCRESAFRETLLLLGFAEHDGVFTGEIPTLLLGSCCKHNRGVNG